MRKVNRLSLFAVSGAAMIAVGITGCGSGSTTSSSTTASTPTATAAAASATLTVASNPKLGSIVTDSKGMTLYRFDKDTANPPKSNCTGQCSALWPAATASGSVTVKGVDKSLVGTVTDADGTKQLTLNGWPLYTYSGDSQPGDANGQGVQGAWFAATPQGGKAKSAAATASSPASSSGGSSSGGAYGY
jgi:predicted lipoprotein with Yx(FWY)xxD motif